MKKIHNTRNKNVLLLVTGLSLMAVMVASYAAGASGDIGSVASQLRGNFVSLAKLITAGSYMAGAGFAVGAILKFKQHKDNPTQIPIGTPIALLFIAGALLFLPSIMKTAGATLYGTGAQSGGVSGVTSYTH